MGLVTLIIVMVIVLLILAFMYMKMHRTFGKEDLAVPEVHRRERSPPSPPKPPTGSSGNPIRPPKTQPLPKQKAAQPVARKSKIQQNNRKKPIYHIKN